MKATRSGPNSVPSDQVKDHIETILSECPIPVTMKDFVRASGVSERTIRNLLTGRAGPTTTRSVARAVFSVTEIMPPDTSGEALVDSAIVGRWLSQMREGGWTVKQVAEVAGVSKATLGRTLPPTITVNTVRGVRRAKIAFDRQQAAMPAPASRCAAQRQIEALKCAGWTEQDIASAAGITPQRVGHILQGRQSSRSAYRAVGAAFRALQNRLGKSKRVANRARRNGYAPWAAWGAGAMSQPDATPRLALVDDPQWREAIRRRYPGCA